MNLPRSDRERFLQECAEVLSAPGFANRFEAFAALVEDWRNSADIHSKPGVASMLVSPVAEPLNVTVL